MERIKEALERARKERAAATPEPAQDSESTTTRGSMGEVSIQYSDTSTVKLDRQAMETKRVCFGEGNDPATRAYKVLRTKVLQRMNAEEWNALAVTSPAPGQGKTLTAVNLAVNLAREMNHTVLLVDLDLTRPSVHQYFCHEPKYGLDDYLFNDISIKDVLFNPSIDRLVVLPTKRVQVSSSEVLGSPRMRELVADLKSRYPNRLVIFDLPPLLSSDDAISFAPYVDAVLMVIREAVTTREDLLQALQALGDTPVIGTVLNDSRDRSAAAY